MQSAIRARLHQRIRHASMPKMKPMTDMKIKKQAPATDEKIVELHARLAEAGQALRDGEFETFVFFVDDTDGNMTAGCKGEIAFRSAHVSELWVDERHRGKGLGSKLLGKVETHAVKQNCSRIHLETRSKSARALYERLGFHVFGKLADYDGNTPFYYLEKPLGSKNEEDRFG